MIRWLRWSANSPWFRRPRHAAYALPLLLLPLRCRAPRLFQAQPRMLLFARLGLCGKLPFKYNRLLSGFGTPLLSMSCATRFGFARSLFLTLAQRLAFARRGCSTRLLALGATGFDGRHAGHVFDVDRSTRGGPAQSATRCGYDPSQALKVTLTSPGGTSASGVASMVTMRGTRRAGGGTGFSVVRSRLEPSALNS